VSHQGYKEGVAMLSIQVLGSASILRTHLAQTFVNPNCFNILHTLGSPVPSWTDIPFTVACLSSKTISLTRCTLLGVCVVCDLPVRGESRTLVCPLSPDNLRQSLVNVSHCLVLTTQELYNSMLLLTNIKRSSHFEGVL
jgi:hypothetical protein